MTRSQARSRGPRAVSKPNDALQPQQRQQRLDQALIGHHLREHVDPARREAMVAEAAYFYAEARGFEPGHELEDWLAAEDQVRTMLALPDLPVPPSPCDKVS